MFPANIKIDNYWFSGIVYGMSYKEKEGPMAFCRFPDWDDRWHIVPIDEVIPIEKEN